MTRETSLPAQNDLHRYFSGAELYGDDFTDDQIGQWYREEGSGYFDLMGAPAQGYAYEYAALNELHGFSALPKRLFGRCLAFGCATGDDVAPLSSLIGEFVAVEPAQEWWRDTIGGRPAHFMAPLPNGEIPVAADSIDLIVCLGVLHHIPNVSKVLAEFSRVLKPGGILVLREPISSMGDWRFPRTGLTKNERGLPRAWLQQRLTRNGFEVQRERHCMLSALAILAGKLGIDRPYSRRWFVYADWLVAATLRFNVRYRRERFLEKLAPGSIFIVAARR